MEKRKNNKKNQKERENEFNIAMNNDNEPFGDELTTHPNGNEDDDTTKIVGTSNLRSLNQPNLKNANDDTILAAELRKKKEDDEARRKKAYSRHWESYDKINQKEAANIPACATISEMRNEFKPEHVRANLGFAHALMRNYGTNVTNFNDKAFLDQWKNVTFNKLWTYVILDNLNWWTQSRESVNYFNLITQVNKYKYEHQPRFDDEDVGEERWSEFKTMFYLMTIFKTHGGVINPFTFCKVLGVSMGVPGWHNLINWKSEKNKKDAANFLIDNLKLTHGTAGAREPFNKLLWTGFSMTSDGYVTKLIPVTAKLRIFGWLICETEDGKWYLIKNDELIPYVQSIIDEDLRFKPQILVKSWFRILERGMEAIKAGSGRSDGETGWLSVCNNRYRGLGKTILYKRPCESFGPAILFQPEGIWAENEFKNLFDHNLIIIWADCGAIQIYDEDKHLKMENALGWNNKRKIIDFRGTRTDAEALQLSESVPPQVPRMLKMQESVPPHVPRMSNNNNASNPNLNNSPIMHDVNYSKMHDNDSPIMHEANSQNVRGHYYPTLTPKEVVMNTKMSPREISWEYHPQPFEINEKAAVWVDKFGKNYFKVTVCDVVQKISKRDKKPYTREYVRFDGNQKDEVYRFRWNQLICLTVVDQMNWNEICWKAKFREEIFKENLSTNQSKYIHRKRGKETRLREIQENEEYFNTRSSGQINQRQIDNSRMYLSQGLSNLSQGISNAIHRSKVSSIMKRRCSYLNRGEYDTNTPKYQSAFEPTNNSRYRPQPNQNDTSLTNVLPINNESNE